MVDMAGGEAAGGARLAAFLKRGLHGFAAGRHDAGGGEAHRSQLSAHLHFGQASALGIALAVRACGGASEADKECAASREPPALRPTRPEAQRGCATAHPTAPSRTGPRPERRLGERA
eukprot:1268127-Prymnesium_polylepis.1